jgi:hypothetical protein
MFVNRKNKLNRIEKKNRKKKDKKQQKDHKYLIRPKCRFELFLKNHYGT